MSFGLHDKDWVDPPDIPPYEGTCFECGKFTPCPCGCGWGLCEDEPTEFIEDDEGCEEGVCNG